MTGSYVLGAAVGLLLMVSGAAKLLNVSRFRDVLLDTYRVRPVLAGVAALTVPVLEMAIGGSLLVPVSSPVALAAAAGLLAGITGMVVRTWAEGGTGDCGCLGALKQSQLSGRTVLRAVGLLSLVVLAWLLSFDIGNFTSAGRTPGLFSVGFTIVGVGVAIAVLAVAGRIWLRWRRGDWEV